MIVIVAPVVTSDMVSVGADPVIVISAPVRLPPGGVTMMSSVGAVPVTVALAAAGVRTESEMSVGAVPVTATLAPEGVSVVVEPAAAVSTVAAADHPIGADCVVLNVVPDVSESDTANAVKVPDPPLLVSDRFVPPLAAVIFDAVVPEPVPITARITSPLLQEIGPMDGDELDPVAVVAAPAVATPV